MYVVTSYAQIIVREVPEVRDTLIVEDTFRYEGQWPEGEGVLYDIDRGMIFGHFSGAVPQGYCTAYFIGGGRYQGEMKEGEENGYGHYFSKSGKIFVGKFENDRAHGVDTLYYPDGRVFIGVVVKGRELDYGEVSLAENHYGASLFKGQSSSSGAFTRWVNAKVKYPKELRSDGRQGAVQVRFFVEPDGSIKDVEVLKCDHESFAEETVRVYYDFTVNFLERY